MEHINTLLGFGKGKKCLIVGGGHSLNEFKFGFVHKDIYFICLNDHYSQMADMIIYYDRKMKKYFDKHFVSKGTKLVGFKNNTIDHTVDRCDYFYTYKDIEFGDSGYHALQMADKIFDFSDIYLIGYDYKTRDKSYHYNEKVSDERLMRKFTGHSIGRVLPMYSKYKWQNRIYNCSKDSNLKLFKHKLPYKENII
jgi:hypothetical protein